MISREKILVRKYLGKKIITQTKSPIPPHIPLKSQMVGS